MSEGQKLAFISPQGTMLLRDELYLKRQGSTPENGGQVIYVIEMARAMAEQGHSVDIFARQYEGDKLEIEIDKKNPKVRIFHIPTAADPSVEKEHFYPHYPEYLGRAIKLVDEQNLKYDAIFGHYADGMTIAAGLEQHYTDKGHPTPLAGVTHSLGLQKAHSIYTTLAKSSDPETTLTEKFNAQMELYNIRPRLGCELSALAHTDAMVCISSAHMHDLFVHYGYAEDKMAIIPNGVNHMVFHKMDDVERKDLVAPLAAARHDIPASTLNLLNNDADIVFGFGRLVKAKGVVNAVKAMEHILLEHPNAVYVNAGGNIPPKNAEEKEVFAESMAYAKEKGYADRIVFLGRQDQSEIAKWLNVSQVYLHCGTLEPFGLAPLEAATTGIPCVLSKEAGVSEVLENNTHALHTDPREPSDIAKQVNRLLANPALGHRLSQHATTYIASEATWAARAKQITNFIDDEIKPLYFKKRNQREMNGNAYSEDARMLISQRPNPAQFGPDVAPYAAKAFDILNTLLPTGLPERNTPEINLDFGGQQANGNTQPRPKHDSGINLRLRTGT